MFHDLSVAARNEDRVACEVILNGLQNLFRVLMVESNPIPVK